MTSTECDACCGFVSLELGLRIVGSIKLVASIMFGCVAVSLMILPGFECTEESGTRRNKELPASTAAICIAVALAEFSYMILAAILMATAGIPKATRIPCCVLVVLSVLHGVSVVCACVFVEPFDYIVLLIGMFVGGVVLTVYMAFIVWGMVRQEKKAKKNPQEWVAPPGGSDGNYGGPVVMSYEVGNYETQPQQWIMATQGNEGINGVPVYGQPYLVQAYTAPIYQAPDYPAQLQGYPPQPD